MKNSFVCWRKRCPGRKNDQGDKRESMSRSRQFSEHRDLQVNWAVTRRWLFSQIGKPWSQVYSDLKFRLKKENFLNVSVLDWITKYIVHPYGEIVNGRLMNEKGDVIFTLGWQQSFYVDKNGILRDFKEEGKTQKKPKWINEFLLDKDRSYKYHKGLWYWVEYGPIVLRPFYHYNLEFYYDILIKDYLPSHATKRVVKKRPVTKKELKMIKSWLAR